ncbi:hypothetical protein GCM10028818_39770 [Spirosoma horti]
MRLFLIGLFMACFVNTGYGIMDCPPSITNGKLYGILPVVNQNVIYSEVIDCGAVSQADLFRRVRLWTAQTCYSPGDSFSLSDKETGDLVGRMTQVVVMPRSANSAGGVYTVHYSLVIECTNRKYRATITHLDVQESGARSIPIEGYCQKNEVDLQALYSTLDGQLRNQLASLQEGVKNYKPF